jgi:hypothetical protein
MMNLYIRANTKQEQRIKLNATLILMEFALDDASNLYTFNSTPAGQVTATSNLGWVKS